MILTIEQLEKFLKENKYHTITLVPKNGGAKDDENYINGIKLMSKTQKTLYEQAIKEITNDVENKDNLKKALIHKYLGNSSRSHLKKQQKEQADNIMYNILGDSEDKLSNNDKQIFYKIITKVEILY